MVPDCRLSGLQTYERFLVSISGLSFPGNWMCPTLPLLPSEHSALSPITYADPSFDGKT